jgi:dihydrofolate reductase
MKRVIASIFLTLDGVAEAPENWTGEFYNDEHNDFALRQLFASDALLLGRKTYEAFVNAWPERTDPDGFADRMNSLPKYVASRTLDRAEWNATLLKGDVATEVSKLKEGDGGDLLIYGSPTLVNYLLPHGLIDEYRLWVHPIVVGGGKHLFKAGLERTVLKHVGTTTFSSGTVVLAYAPA